MELVTRQRAQRLIDANLASPLEYQSADDAHVTFRLKDGNTYRLTGEQARAVDELGHVLRWSHLEGVVE